MQSITKLILVAIFTLTLNSKSMGAQQVEIHLRSGQIVTGELINEKVDLFTIKITRLGKTAKAISITADYQRKDIVELFHLDDPEKTYLERLATTLTANQHAALATWSREQAMLERALKHAQQALTLDPQNEIATALMKDFGWVQNDGKWIKESELLTSQGKVRYQGKVMTVDEADAIKTRQQQQLVVYAVQQTVDYKTSELAKINQQIDLLALRLPQIEAALAADVAAIAVNQSTIQSVEPLRAAVDVAHGNLQAAQTAFLLCAHTCRSPASPAISQSGCLTPYIDATYLYSLTHTYESAQKAYNQARDLARTAEWEISLLNNHMASLATEKNAVDKRTITLKYTRDSIARGREKAQVALAALKDKMIE